MTTPRDTLDTCITLADGNLEALVRELEYRTVGPRARKLAAAIRRMMPNLEEEIADGAALITHREMKKHDEKIAEEYVEDVGGLVDELKVRRIESNLLDHLLEGVDKIIKARPDAPAGRSMDAVEKLREEVRQLRIDADCGVDTLGKLAKAAAEEAKEALTAQLTVEATKIRAELHPVVEKMRCTDEEKQALLKQIDADLEHEVQSRTAGTVNPWWLGHGEKAPKVLLDRLRRTGKQPR